MATQNSVNNTITGNSGTATALQNSRTLWGQSFDGSANVTGSLTSVGNITGGASSMTILAGTGASRTLTLQTTSAGSAAQSNLVLNADLSTTVGGTLAMGSNSITMTGSLAATGARVTKGWFTDIESTNMPTVGGISLSTTFAPKGSVTSSGLTMNTARLLGRTTGSSGAIEEITVGSGLSLSAGSLSVSGASATSTTKSINQVAHGFSVNDVIKFSGTTYQKAKADSSANAEVVGIVTAVADADNFTFTMEGYISGLTALTSDTVYFLSDATAGLLTATEPTTVGSISKPVLKTTSTTTGVMNNMRGIAISAPISITYKNGVTTYNLSTASGTQTIAHGLGTTPHKVRLTAYVASTSGGQIQVASGAYNGTTTSGIYGNNNINNGNGNSSTNILTVYPDSGSTNKQECTISVDSTNITLTWTKTNSPTGTLQMLWEVE